MDPRFEVNLAPRRTPAGVDGQTPLVTLGWRALHKEYEARADERVLLERRIAELHAFLVRIADETHALRRQAPDLAARLEQALKDAEVELLAPVDVPYDADLMEYLENAAQQPRTGITAPRIVEVLAPAVLRRGVLLRMGKVVIAVPAFV